MTSNLPPFKEPCFRCKQCRQSTCEATETFLKTQVTSQLLPQAPQQPNVKAELRRDIHLLVPPSNFCSTGLAHTVHRAKMKVLLPRGSRVQHSGSQDSKVHHKPRHKNGGMEFSEFKVSFLQVSSSLRSFSTSRRQLWSSGSSSFNFLVCPSLAIAYCFACLLTHSQNRTRNNLFRAGNEIWNPAGSPGTAKDCFTSISVSFLSPNSTVISMGLLPIPPD